MALQIGGTCPSCGYDRMFQHFSGNSIHSYVACPNCAFGYGRDGIIPFEEWQVKVHAYVARELARYGLKTVGRQVADLLPWLNISHEGLEPVDGLPFDRDPYYTLFRDLSVTELHGFSELEPIERRLLLLEITGMANKMADLEMFIYRDLVIENYKSSLPILLKKIDGDNT